MTPTQEDRWASYKAWNDALADVIYSPAAAGSPAYLDLEAEVLNNAALIVGEPGDPRTRLLNAVQATLNPADHRAGAFGGHLAQLRRWSPGDGTPPPVIALLAVMSLAAEDMREDGGIAANNYYDRLMPLFGITSARDKDRIIKSYRRNSFDLWESLNGWLVELRGEHGLPTAYAYAHAHVGLPLSQALIRSTDREKLNEMFVELGLEAHARLSPQDMELELGQWISRNPSPASHQMVALWRRKGARERITEIACELLQAWEPPPGSALTTHASGSVAARRATTLLLLARLRTFPASTLELNVVGPDLGEDETVAVLDPITGDATGTDLAIDRLPDGRWRLAQGDLIEAHSMLEGMLRVQHPAGITLEHRPRRVVPLKRDTLVQAFVEAERLGLGEEGLLLAQDAMRPIIEDALSKIARPGFRLQSPHGLPAGWCLFTDVQILVPLVSTTPSTIRTWPIDLNVLQPLASSQTVIEGGLQLPGRLRRWSTLAPPEVRVAADQAEEICIRIERVETFLETADSHSWVFPGSVALVDLADLHLKDGDYEIAATSTEPGAKKPRSIGTSRLRLRSADQPNMAPIGVGRLGRPLTGMDAAALYASEVAPDTAAVRGAKVANAPGCVLAAPTELPDKPAWWQNRQERPERSAPLQERRIILGSADPSDCFRTGSHVFVLPTFYGKTSKSTIEGVCKICGLVKRFPSRYRHPGTKSAGKISTEVHAPAFNPRSLRPVVSGNLVDANTALDALTHDRAGRAAWLEQLALQVEPSQLFVDQFIRGLDALGHIEVKRKDTDLRLIAWEVMPSRLAGLSSGQFALVGARSRRLMTSLKDGAETMSLAVRRVQQGLAAPDLVAVAAETVDDAMQLAAIIKETQGIQVDIVPDASAAITATLPALSSVLASRPSQPIPAYTSARRWDAQTCRWSAIGDASKPGSYQLSGITTTYWLRKPEHIDAGTGLRLDARLVKYAAAHIEGDSIIGYDAENSVLFVPLGADLPGLYGRAAILASGLLPDEDTKQRLLQYRDVPPAVVAHLATLLSN